MKIKLTKCSGHRQRLNYFFDMKKNIVRCPPTSPPHTNLRLFTSLIAPLDHPPFRDLSGVSNYGTQNYSNMYSPILQSGIYQVLEAKQNYSDKDTTAILSVPGFIRC